MKTSGILGILAAMALLQGCATTPEQQQRVGCVGATTMGALAGAALGNQLGGGTGQQILTATGAAAGANAGAQASGC